MKQADAEANKSQHEVSGQSAETARDKANGSRESIIWVTYRHLGR
jgi:hypothetical protein